MPEKPLLLTFDDGHWDFATNVLPILKKHQVKATQYVIPGFTGGSDFMTENQVWNVVSSGLVDVGAHTVHHISLAGKPLHEVQYEIGESKRMLENTYHIQVVSFAYPNGSFDNQAADVVKMAGFTTGVSTVPGIIQSNANRFFLYRLRPGHRTGIDLLHWLQQSEFKPFQ
jgi:peptidoglycan/xylan/chitin deacetylase (PgdA/CDA1 family)